MEQSADATMIDKLLDRDKPQKTVKPVALDVQNAKTAGVVFENRELFKPGASRTVEDAALRNVLIDGTIFEPDQDGIQQILKNDTNFMTLRLPGNGGVQVELELVKVNIFDQGFSVKTSAAAAEVTRGDLGVHYQGIVKGDPYSIAAISVFKNEIAGFFYSETKGNNVVGRLGGDNTANRHVVYAENDLLAKPDHYCAVKDEPQTDLPISILQPEAPQVTCVRMFLEANFDLFQNKGSVANTTAYVTALFNQSATLYRNDGVSVSISEIFVWNSASPYVNTTSSSAVLTQYRTTRTSFNGNLAHLLTLANYGGIAYLNVVCNPSFRYGLTGIDPTFQNVPTYSWSVDAFTHEVGHNLGSSHTHACVWNGNGTAIDSCGPLAGYAYEGTCTDAPLPSNGQGTIMSYCHLNIGKNLALGFGPQPTAVIQNRVANGTCLTDCGATSTLQFSTSGYTVNEAIGTATVLVSRQGTAAGVSVNYATSDVTATAGQDYTAVSGTLNFAAGETIKSFNIPITDDIAVEGSETIGISLNTPGGGVTLGTPNTSIVTITNNDTARARFDYDGDAKTDVSVFRPSNGVWYVQNSSNGSFSINAFGLAEDKTVPADYDGDGKTDLAVWRPSNGVWFWLNSGNGTLGGNQFGLAGDIPAPGDYEGDGKADIMIYRPSAGQWWCSRSSGNLTVTFFGTAEDKPAVGDFDGDGKTDVSLFRPSNGTWYRLNSSTGLAAINSFGLSDDKPVAADYDADGKADIAVYRPSTGAWYWVNSGAGTIGANAFGISEDLPTPGDYDGDGKSDLAVFRPSQGIWYLLRTTSGFNAVAFGTAGDVPTPNSFVP